ncbi:MAG: VOC family protein [Acidobacteriia bacterium]|nr:VOC family protein [Terriglobia bacterium]
MANKKAKKARKGASHGKHARPTRGGSGRTITRMKVISDKPGWMKIQGVQLVFTTKNPPVIASFYRDTLGFVEAAAKRPGMALKPGFSRAGEVLGGIQIQPTRDTGVDFQDYSLAYHQITQMGGRPPEEPLYGQIFLIVDDANKIYERLSKKGVQFFGPPREMPSGHLVAECADPEGRRIIFAEILKKRR